MSDAIRLTACSRPELRIQESKCSRCGNPILNVGNLCAACMNRGFRQEVMAQQGRILREQPAARLGTATDKLHRRHVALIGKADLSFCGLQLDQPQRKQLYVFADQLPPDTCALCADLIQKARKGDTK